MIKSYLSRMSKKASKKKSISQPKTGNAKDGNKTGTNEDFELLQKSRQILESLDHSALTSNLLGTDHHSTFSHRNVIQTGANLDT